MQASLRPPKTTKQSQNGHTFPSTIFGGYLQSVTQKSPTKPLISCQPALSFTGMGLGTLMLKEGTTVDPLNQYKGLPKKMPY